MYNSLKPTKNICSYHNNIISIAKDLQRLKADDFMSLEHCIDYILSRVDDIESDAQLALQAGQNMEDRLFEYRNAIESLGFTRNKSA